VEGWPITFGGHFGYRFYEQGILIDGVRKPCFYAACFEFQTKLLDLKRRKSYLFNNVISVIVFDFIFPKLGAGSSFFLLF